MLIYTAFGFFRIRTYVQDAFGGASIPFLEYFRASRTTQQDRVFPNRPNTQPFPLNLLLKSVSFLPTLRY